MFQLKALVSLDLFKNKTKLLMTSFTLTMYGLELFITAFLSMANYTGWELSFQKQNKIIDDVVYPNHVRFRTLHNCFFINGKLYRMGIKNSPECTACGEGFNSNVQILLECRVV